MSNISQVYGANIAITLTANGLASSLTAGREGTAINNSTNTTPALDGSLTLAFNLNSSTAPTGDIIVGITLASDGTDYGTPATGSDAALTLPRSFPIAEMEPDSAGILYIPRTSIIYCGKIECFGFAANSVVTKVFNGVAARCGGTIPALFSVFILNQTGSTLGAVEANHKKIFSPIYAQSV